MCREYLLAIGVLFVCALLNAAYAAALPTLVPAPQRMAWTSGAEAWLPLDGLTGVVLPDSAAADMAALKRLRARAGKPVPASRDGNLRLNLGTLPDEIPAGARAEAYQLVVEEAAISILAETRHGLHHGLVSLTELIDTEKGVPCVSITDWPDRRMRGTYVPGIAQAEERFDQFVALKLNLLLLEDGALYDLDVPEVCARFQRLAARCRANHIEFVPELQSLGWGHFVIAREPRAVEPRWVSRAPFPVHDRRVHAPDPELPPPPVMENPSFEAGLAGWTAQTHVRRWQDAAPHEAAVVALDGGDGQVLQLALQEPATVRVHQDVAVQPDARYAARCRIRTRDVQGDSGAYIEVYGIHRNGAMTMIGQNSHHVRGTTEWQESEVVFTTGVIQRVRPGGGLMDDSDAPPREGYEQVRVFVRLQDAAGVAWFDTVEIEPLRSPNPLANVVATEITRIVVESEDAETLYEEERDYTLQIPELRYPYGFGEPLELALTENSRISDGDTLLLSFNQANSEDVTCCPSEPLYDAFMRRSIENVVEKLNPNYLHIGHDEPRFFNRCQRCADRNLSNEALFVDAIKRIHASAKAANPEMRIMLWDDAINPYQNGPSLDTSGAAAHLPRDIIVNVWWYDNFAWEAQLEKSTRFFLDLGFEVTGSPWYRIPNAYRWAELFSELQDDPKALGIIYTSWGEVPEPWAALEFTAEHCWSFGKPAYAP